MALVVRAFPVDDRVRVDTFVRELHDRETEAREFYTSFGVRRETWFFQPHPSGGSNVVVGVTEVTEPLEMKAAQYADADDPFATWFKAHVYALSGIDPDITPLGPLTIVMHNSFGEELPSGAVSVRVYAAGDRAGEIHAPATFLQKTEDGDIVIALYDGEVAETAAEAIYEFMA